MMMYEICAVLECGRVFDSFCCCGVSVGLGVSDGCTEEKERERGMGIKYPWVNVIVLYEISNCDKEDRVLKVLFQHYCVKPFLQHS